MSRTTHYLIEPQDTWLFRESRPMGGPGGSELKSNFPPPPRTVLGALRTAMGDATGVDWHDFRSDHPLTQQIGYGDDLGPLCPEGLWVTLNEQRLYPTPAMLLKDTDGQSIKRLHIGGVLETHLGRLRLPRLPNNQRGLKPLGKAWLTEEGFERVLNGGIPKPDQVIWETDLFVRESRLGISRDNLRRTAEDGGLYQTQHLRLCPGVGLEVRLTHAEGGPEPLSTVRLGGEGRLAHIHRLDSPKPPLPPLPNASNKAHGLMLTLISPAKLRDADARPTWLPDPSFKTHTLESGQRIWRGTLNGIELDLHCAVIDKALREGGWDLAAKTPRAMQSLIPAGAGYYFKPTSEQTPWAEIRSRLHELRIGQDTQLGRGLAAYGLWPATEDRTP